MSTTTRSPLGEPRRVRPAMRAAVPVAALALLLTACGASASGNDTGAAAPAAGTTPTTSPSPGQGGAGPNGQRSFGGMDFTKIQQCLDAAGLDIMLPTFDPNNRPSGMPPRDPNSTERPSPPAGETRPSGAPGDGQGFGGGNGQGGGVFRELFTNPDVQAALQACGIELPQRPPGGQAGPTPSASS